MGLRDRTSRINESYQPKLWLTLGALVLVIAYVLYFVAANDTEVSVKFLFFEATTSLIWVILFSVVLGLLAGVLLSQLYRRRRAASRATPSEIRSGDS
jgi:uncharacterized integral membrane protein